MKLTGKEDAGLCIEENGKPYLTICQLNWHQLLNDVIIDRICNELQKNNNIQKYITRYITINNKKISKNSILKLKVQASLKEGLPGMKNNKYDSTNNSLKVQDFYNYIIGLFEFYACELDTYINNIKLELVELEIIDEKPLTKIRICCADSEYFEDYIGIIEKYSIYEISINRSENCCDYFADIYVESLDFLLQFIEDIKPLHPSDFGDYEGFIFTMIEKGYYCIEIYNGYRE